MLKYFTWQQFLVAALVLSIIWYTVIILLFYHHKIQDYLNGKNKDSTPSEPLRHAWDEDFEDNPLGGEDDLMGKSALPEGMTRLSMAQFGFAPRISDAATEQEAGESWDTATEQKGADEVRERQQSIIPDVLEELKSIFHILETQQGTKQDFISLFGLVSTKYHSIKGTANQQALNDYIRENVLFPISDEELDNLWQ
ncbi:hypothetical protein [Mucilaginibacter panaciglaebae]|uniref:Uncharacterized protein n=1 Tax=Mucilaginibacter panaciglaebae TaxID=502331 RepID=A0ABP7WKD3_9SPHI